MTRTSLAFALALLAGPALAQTPLPPSSPPPPGPSGPDRGPPAPGDRPAFISIKGPHGSSVTVRCASGEPTRACADIVSSLVDKMTARHGQMGGRDGGSMDRDRDDRDDRRYRDRY